MSDGELEDKKRSIIRRRRQSSARIKRMKELHLRDAALMKEQQRRLAAALTRATECVDRLMARKQQFHAEVFEETLSRAIETGKRSDEALSRLIKTIEKKGNRGRRAEGRV